MNIPCRCERQIDSSLYTLLRAGREGIDGGSAGQNMVPYGPHLKTTTTAWRSRMSNLNTMFYLASSQVRVGGVPRTDQAKLYYLGWTDDVDNPEAEAQPYPTVREFEEAAWVALGLVIGKTCPRNATDPDDVENPPGAPPKPPEPLQRPNGVPKKHNVTRVGDRKMSRGKFEREQIEATQGSLLNAI